jgi:hypothetical protein
VSVVDGAVPPPSGLLEAGAAPELSPPLVAPELAVELFARESLR